MSSADPPYLSEPPHLEADPIDDQKPVIIGLYGLPGSGKTYWLDKIQRELRDKDFAYYDGSDVIAAVTPGGLDAFQKLSKDDQISYRELAISKIQRECHGSGKGAIVAGHFMFWTEGDDHGQTVCTSADLKMYTHILYLDVPPEEIANYRQMDKKRSRPETSLTHLKTWQQTEKDELRRVCRSHGILFTTTSSMEKLCPLILDFREHTEELNMSRAKAKMDEMLASSSDTLETILVLDADKTLAAHDSGVRFWQQMYAASSADDSCSPLKSLFSGPLGYSYTAFRQATLLYEESASDESFDQFCSTVSWSITMYPEFAHLLDLVTARPHVRAIVLTCGLRSVWECVLRKERLGHKVRMIGGGRLAEGFVITPVVKTALVTHLRDTHQLYVFAFGDSPIDLGMLQAADMAIVITGEERTRSKSMENALAEVIGKDGFYPRQVVLAHGAKPRLDTTRLPLVELMEPAFIDSVIARRRILHVLHGTERPAAKLLMASMRNASISGPALREAHRRVGWYLATEFCTQAIGIAPYPIVHVQGHETEGHRLLHEKETLIVPLMRGGDPMASGVHDAFPLAMYLHAKVPSDIQPDHLKGMVTIILVDSVVNSGKSVLQFVKYIRNFHATINIVIVAGVIHSDTVSTSSIARSLGRVTNLSFIALRLSDNKFVGKGNTDTGNRLFNTVHVD
ncbi:hypothetical protein N7475_008705 [Penicillium sp. IBT 31633x]|nr:hypothetical protein N7475_008705 [Penicillium sp. IBT 31633x]